jgi:dTDP-4-dehydrorhamnose reductase
MAFRNILVTGARGMFGKELVPYLRAKGYTVVATDSESLNLLETAESIQAKLAQWEPEVIIHTAAFTNVDAAEADADLAMAVNKDGTQKLAMAAREVGAIMAYISTDYVFDGSKHAPYAVTDRPSPISAYGLSKYYGELMVTELLEEYYIIRTSWLYGIHGRNFVQFVLDSARQGRPVTIIDDQFGSPTWTGSLCNLVETIFTSGQFGTYHAADQGAISRYDQALAICKAVDLSTDHIRPIASREFAQAAQRPAFSALDTGDLPVPSWTTSLQAFIQQYLNHSTN